MSVVKLVFVDMETLSLPRGTVPPVPWEVAYITATLDPPIDVDEDGKSKPATIEIERAAWFQPTDAGRHLREADPMSLRIGGFYDRYKQPIGGGIIDAEQDDADWEDVARACNDRWWVGACPDFDEKIARAEMHRRMLMLASHYHLIDVEQYAAGRFRIPLPWNLKTVMERAGVQRSPLGAHTALGDTIDCVRLFAAAADATITNPDVLTGLERA